MPLYEYRCNACGKVFEKMARWSEADHSPLCPSCQSQDTRRKVSVFASSSNSSSSAFSSSVSSGSSCGSRGGFG